MSPTIVFRIHQDYHGYQKKNLSLRITICHHLACLVMQNIWSLIETGSSQWIPWPSKILIPHVWIQKIISGDPDIFFSHQPISQRAEKQFLWLWSKSFKWIQFDKEDSIWSQKSILYEMKHTGTHHGRSKGVCINSWFVTVELKQAGLYKIQELFKEHSYSFQGL